MSRHTLDLNMGGNAEAKLAGVEAGIGRVARAAEETSKAFKRAGDAVEDVSERVDRVAAGSMSTQFQNLADRLSGASMQIRASGREFVEGVIKDASTFEDAQSEMRFAFKNDWENIYGQVLKDAADLTIVDAEGRNALQIAKEAGRDNCSALLRAASRAEISGARGEALPST